MKQNIKAFPYCVYFGSILLLVIIGFIDSIYLSYSHYLNYTDIGYSSFCAISKAINCDTVSQSPYSIFLNLPVAVWGALGYVFLILLISVARCNKPGQADLWTLIFLTSFVYSLISIILALVSTFLVRSYCIMCILTYGINLAVLYFSWIIIRRFDKREFFQRIGTDLQFFRSKVNVVLPATLLLVVTVIILWKVMPNYWKFELPEASVVQMNKGVTEKGYPWIGADNPTITITEFSDYMCFQCRKMHSYLRRMVAKYPERIRLIHRHFPMDKEYNPLVKDQFHSGSGKMAILGIYALYKDQFWEVNDLLFEIASQKKDFNTRTIADFMNVNIAELTVALKSKALRLRLKHDIAIGLDLGITGTPTFQIDGEVYLGNIPAEILRSLKDR